VNGTTRLLSAVCAALWLVSCSEPTAAEAGAGRFDVACEAELCTASIELAQGQPVRGENRFLVSVTPSSASLTRASALMVAHGHGSDGSIEPGEPIEVTLDLFMAGRWDVTFELSVEDATDQLEFSVDVP
jgi:hypothetical protein